MTVKELIDMLKEVPQDKELRWIDSETLEYDELNALVKYDPNSDTVSIMDQYVPSPNSGRYCMDKHQIFYITESDDG